MSKRDDPEIPVIVKLIALFFLAITFCAGCSSPQGELFSESIDALIWPGPPEQARIKFVGVLSTQKDLKKEVSWSESFTELIFGKKKTGVLIGPYSVVVDGNQKLYAADSGGGLIQMFDLVTRDYKQFYSISENKRLLSPVSLCFVDDELYVVDSVLHEVCVFDSDGNFLRSFGNSILKRPSGIAYWDGGSKIYVSDTGGHTVNVFNKQGQFQFDIGQRGIEAGEFNFPTHVWSDQEGKLYVSDTLNYRIQIFSGDGKYIKMFGTHGDMPGYFAHPCGIATDNLGNIYVTDRQFENFQIFDKDGNILLAIGSEGSGPGQFWLPGGIYIDKTNRIYIADSFNKRIQIFDLLTGSN